MSLANKNARMMNGLGQSKLEDLGLQTSFQEILGPKRNSASFCFRQGLQHGPDDARVRYPSFNWEDYKKSKIVIFRGRLGLFYKSFSRLDLAVFSFPKRVSKCLLAVSNSSILPADSRF